MIQASDFPLLDHLSSGILAIEQDGTIRLWNRTLENWYGKQREEMQGCNLFQTFPHLDNASFRHDLKRVFDGTSTVIFTDDSEPLIPCPLASGVMRPQKVTVSLLEQQQLALFSIEDQTEQRKLISGYKAMADSLQTELNQITQLEKQNSRLIGAIDQAAEAIMIARADGGIDYVNRAFHQQTGWQSDDLQNLTLERLFAETSDEFKAHLAEVFSAGKTWQGRQKIVTHTGSEFTASVSIAPISDVHGITTHAVIIQEDISQQLAIDERLRHSQKQEALVTLVGGIAHDFNNLLAGLVGQTYLATREVQQMPKTLERLNKIQKITQNASEIVKQLLTFARQGDHQAKEFPLSSFIKEFHKLAKLTVPESIKLTLDFLPGDYPFRGDASQLQQSLLNMIQNAVEACANKQEGSIDIMLSPLQPAEQPTLVAKHPVLRHGNFAHIILRDNGCGIAADNMERIFDPFFTTKQLGSGLGLAIVLGCIRNHHGIIDVESRSGEGTTFHLLLPLKVYKTAPVAPLITDNAISARILLVDDDPNVLEPTKELLECMGHHVTLARDGLQAYETFKLKPEEWDIVITDMVMPRMNGLESAQKMREISPSIPIIFATGYDKSLVIDQTRNMANAILISKPFNPDDLDQMIVDMVKKSR